MEAARIVPSDKRLLNIIAAYLGHNNFILIHQIAGTKTCIDTRQGVEGTIKIMENCVTSMKAKPTPETN